MRGEGEGVTEVSLHRIDKLPLNKHPQLIKYLISRPAEATENNLHIVNLPGNSRIAARLGESGGGAPAINRRWRLFSKIC